MFDDDFADSCGGQFGLCYVEMGEPIKRGQIESEEPHQRNGNWSKRSVCDQRSNLDRPLFLGIGPSKVHPSSGANLGSNLFFFSYSRC